MPGQSFVAKTFGKLGLVSEKYALGNFQDAFNVNCSIVPEHPSDILKKMKLAVYDFAPFASYDNYCLHIHPYSEPVICSGSSTLQTSYGPIESSSGWEFRLALNSSGYYLPKVKFWIIITGNYLFSIV